jgi:hypothetical protein
VNLARDLGLDLEQGMSLRVLGQASLVNGQPKPAMDAFEKSHAILSDLDPYEAARTKTQWGLALVSGGDVERGTSLLEEARAAFATLGARRDLAAVEEWMEGTTTNSGIRNHNAPLKTYNGSELEDRL